MEARAIGSLMSTAILVLGLTSPSLGQFRANQKAVVGTTNFIVFASSPQWATQVAQVAEQNRRELALHWLGHELPQWSERVPIHVESGPHLGASGETRFTLLDRHRIGQWMMIVAGTPERIVDSVLPHEITHTIFATHFAPLGKYVPRWADEGACTTVEHISEKRKHREQLVAFLQNRRGLPFNKMFSLTEYPPDIMPLYAQGHSTVQFLIDQGGPQKFVKFLESGMRSNDWTAAVREFYDYESIGQFQTMWNQWLLDGSPSDLIAYAPSVQQQPSAEPVAATLSLVAATASAETNQPRVVTNESWYKRRLREVSGKSLAQAPLRQPAATELSSTSVLSEPQELLAAGFEVTSAADSVDGLRPPQSVGRSMGVTPATVQVLDWGNSAPVPGLAPGTPQPLPAETGHAAPWLR